MYLNILKHIEEDKENTKNNLLLIVVDCFFNNLKNVT